MNEDILNELKRIADLLEALLERPMHPVQVIHLTPPSAAVPATYGTIQTGYQCSCGTWVMPGASHSCVGRITYTSIPPNTSGTWTFPIGGTTVGKTFS